MKTPHIFKKMRCELNMLHLADKCLLIFMFLLMFQSTHNLFFHELAMLEGTSFNVIVRTTAAAIFGYFISANFQHVGRDKSENEENFSGTPVVSTDNYKNENQPLYGIDNIEPENKDSNADDKITAKQRNCLQIIVVAAIGLTALILLIIAHDFFEDSSMATATISQLRDFVSGSVGFLIGHSTHPAKSA
ncbi:MAG: hypothetical protein RR398_01375 [Clostridia bacterium]